MLGDNYPPLIIDEEPQISEHDNQSILRALPDNVRQELGHIVAKEKIKFEEQNKLYRQQWEAANLTKILEMEAENKRLREELMENKGEKMEQSGGEEDERDKKASSSSSGSSSSSSSSSSSEEERRKKRKKRRRRRSPKKKEEVTLYLDKDLKNLPDVNEPLPRTLFYSGISVTGIRRVSMALEYARLVKSIPAFVFNGDPEEIEEDLARIRAKQRGRSTSKESEGSHRLKE